MGAVLMIKSIDHLLVNNYELTTCALQSVSIKKVRHGYTAVWLENSTGCSVLQSPLSWYEDARFAQAQSSIYPLSEELSCWCNRYDYYEYPLVGSEGYTYELVATCYLDPIIMTYMQQAIAFFTIGKVSFWIGMVTILISSVYLVMYFMNPMAEPSDPNEKNKLLQ